MEMKFLSNMSCTTTILASATSLLSLHLHRASFGYQGKLSKTLTPAGSLRYPVLMLTWRLRQ
jgi:hypothetical protein